MENFIDWLKKEAEKQGWSNNELGRRLGITSGAISLILSGRRKPTWKFCMKVATALNKSPIFVFRMAGLLPSVSEEQQREEDRALTEAEQKMVETIRGLQSYDRETLNRVLDALARDTDPKGLLDL